MGCKVALSYQLFISLLIVFLYADILVVVCKSNLCRSEERFALVQFKNHFSIIKSHRSCLPKTFFWKEDDEDCCMWFGVSCDDMTGHVVGLDLSSSCLNGTIPLNSSLFSLVHLERLDVSNNLLANSLISPSFGNLSKLTLLYLTNSEFSGIIPDEIFQLPKLEQLDLSQNYGLTGKFVRPNATQLSDLNLYATGFTGVLPDSVEQLKSLVSLDISYCKCFGSIPMSLGKLTKLESIQLENNNFSGEIPSSIFYLHNLRLIDLSNNNLEGSIPLLSNLTYLREIRFQGNALSGHISTQFLNLSKLLTLDISENRLTGTIDLKIFAEHPRLWNLRLSKSGLSVSITDSSILSALPSIGHLHLSYCSISASNLTYFTAPEMVGLDLSRNNIDTEIHPSICSVHYLKYLDLSDNWLGGVIPDCFRRSSWLQVLKLEKNNLEGIIPWSIGYLSWLQVLDLSDNQLVGVVPRSLANCSELQVLNLGNNMLVDYFPFWLVNMPVLKLLILRGNKIHGRITGKFKSGSRVLSNLQLIDVSYNYLTCILPANFFLNLISMMNVINNATPEEQYLNEGDDNIFYSLQILSKGQSLEYSKVSINLKAVDFSHNKFNGNIPSSVGLLKGIKVLNFSGNILNGPIPSSLGNLTNLESLDLSGNELFGKVPPELVGLSFLEVFDVSHNNLTGPIPLGGQFNTFPSTSYEGNPGLCGPPLQKLCSNITVKIPTPAPKKSQHIKFEVNGFGWEEVFIGYVCGVVFGLVIGCVFIEEEWLRRLFRLKMHRN